MIQETNKSQNSNHKFKKITCVDNYFEIWLLEFA